MLLGNSWLQRPSLFYIALCGSLAIPSVSDAESEEPAPVDQRSSDTPAPAAAAEEDSNTAEAAAPAADTSENDADAVELDTVNVEGTLPSEFKTESIQSPKFQAPLVDTPKTVDVVPEEVVKQQNAQTLEDVLSNVPGITFSSGEGRGGWGDMFSIRGFSSDDSVTVDGVRDSVLSNRNDTFNLEQAEVYKGTGAIEHGVGAAGGSVNLVSKTPKKDTFYNLSGGGGSDGYVRGTADINQELGDTSAFRLNLMRHKNNVPKRGEADYDRKGVAPSFTWGLDTDTRVTASYFYQKDENMPDFGLPLTRDGHRMRGVKRDYWGGYQDTNKENTESQSALLRVEHDFTDKISVRNQTSWMQTKRFTHLTTGGRMLNAPDGAQPGDVVPSDQMNMDNFYGYDAQDRQNYPSGHRGMARLEDFINSYKGRTLSNQTDFNFDFKTGDIRHQIATGFEFYQETFRQRPYEEQGTTGAMVVDVRDPETHYSGDTTTKESSDRSGSKIDNWSIYAHDHITLNKYLHVAGGVRYDKFRAKWYEPDGEVSDEKQREGVWSGSAGIIFKPVEYGSIYASYSQSSQPSASAAANSGGGNDDNVSDYSVGESETWEIGSKWDLLDDRLAVTGAIFQTERSNPTDEDPDDPSKIIQSGGKERVRGAELGLNGNITSDWSVYAGGTVLSSKIIEHEDPEQVGGKMKNVPRSTFNLWTNYRFTPITPKLQAGFGAQYVGKRRFAEGNTVESNMTGKKYSANKYIPSYWVFNASASYQVNDQLSINVNVDNIFNKFYLSKGTASRLGYQQYGVPGPGRSATVTANFTF